MRFSPASLAAVISLALCACTQGPTASGDQASFCIEIGGQIVTDLDWSPDQKGVGVLGSTGDGEWVVGLLDPIDRKFVELARGADIVPTGMTADSGGVVFWQSSAPGMSQLHSGSADGKTQQWALPPTGFMAIEKTTDQFLATQLASIGDGADALDVVRVDLAASPPGITVLNRQTGVESLAATVDGSTVATGGQQEVAGPMFVHVSGEATWSSAAQDGAPDVLALAPDAGSAMIRDVSSGTAMWLFPDGSTSRTVLGDTEVQTFDVAADSAIVHAAPSGGGSKVCVVSKD